MNILIYTIELINESVRFISILAEQQIVADYQR